MLIDLPEEQVSCQASLACSDMFSHGQHRQNRRMPRAKPTPADEGSTLEQRREWQRKLLENLPKWLRYRGLKQRDVANALGTSEAQISKYFGGKVLMSVAHLREIASVLKAHPGDLLKPPPEEGMGLRVEETLKLMDELTPGEWEAVLATARAIRSAKTPT